MAKKSSSTSSDTQFIATQANLDRKGKTNKKLKSNVQASKYLSVEGKKLKETAEAFYKEHFKKGRRTAIKLKKAEEARIKEEQRQKELKAKKQREKDLKDIKDVMKGSNSRRKKH